MTAAALMYGSVPVPWTVAWTGEDADWQVRPCREAGGRPAVVQRVARGEGRPTFGKPHMQRQREATGRGLCDTCGKALAARTKVSLSHAAPRIGAGGVLAVLQVEPLLHRECAWLSATRCPSLLRDIGAGSLVVRQVTRWRPQLAILDEVAVAMMTGVSRRAVGHGKVELQAWTDRDLDWLEARS